MSSRYGFYDCHSVANKISCFIYIFILELNFTDSVVAYNNYTSTIVLWHVSEIFVGRFALIHLIRTYIRFDIAYYN